MSLYIIHGIILRETRETPRDQRTDLERAQVGYIR